MEVDKGINPGREIYKITDARVHFQSLNTYPKNGYLNFQLLSTHLDLYLNKNFENFQKMSRHFSRGVIWLKQSLMSSQKFCGNRITIPVLESFTGFEIIVYVQFLLEWRVCD